uniref:Uncharacterized protein n=1 Tax=Arundo donax TaxID=35708 RepID=A0A0A9A9B8_ARUDO
MAVYTLTEEIQKWENSNMIGIHIEQREKLSIA